jgi:cobalamin biosynthesis protein CobT
MTESTFKTRLNSILKDNAIERFVGGKKKGTINTKRLYKITDSKKIFKQREERKGKDYSISFLLDASGSMNSTRDTVSESLAHIGNALNKTDIPFSIYSFSDCTRLIKTFEDKYNRDDVTRLYNKTFHESFYHCNNCHQYDLPVKNNCHQYDLPVKKVKRAKGQNHPPCPYCGFTLSTHSNGGTNDALALHIVGTEVHKAYKKNILVVITDGSGDYIGSRNYMYGKVAFSKLQNNRTVIHQLHKSYKDLILLAISIGGDYTKAVYGQQYSKNIKRPDEIFNAVAQLLARHIKRG